MMSGDPKDEFPEDEATLGDGKKVEELAGAPSFDEAESTLSGSESPPVEEAPAEGQPQPEQHLEGLVEALLFAADKPLNLQGLAQILGATDVGPIRAAVAALEEHYASRGMQLHQVAGGWQFRTNPAHATWVQRLLAQKPVRLSRAQLETLAICAYRQPITRPEVDEIRGVDSGGSLKTLMDRALVRILGKKEEPGRPLLYGTTREFLDFFSLRDLKDLPTLREFHELSEEHRAQVAALESKAPDGSIETEAEAAEASSKPLERVTYEPPAEDAAELEEIDRLISTAGGAVPVEIVDPEKTKTSDDTQ
jgi:segregation and condensation protein B